MRVLTTSAGVDIIAAARPEQMLKAKLIKISCAQLRYSYYLDKP